MDIPMSVPVVKNHIKTVGNTMQHEELRTYRCSGLVNRTSQLVYGYILNIGIAGLNGGWFYHMR